MTKRIHILILAALMCGLRTAAQGFFNLTAEQVRIDSLLPCFTHIHDLGYNFADSLYDVSVEYPEFVPMTDTDIRRYHRITSDSLPEMPVVNSNIAVARKRGQLDITFVPLVCRDGRMMKLVSFKLTVTARPRPKAAKSTSATGAAGRYANHSVLRDGTWVKIRVPHSGVYQLTNALITRAGFSDPARVKIYGYGGALQPERLTGSYLTTTDDLKEVPTCTVDGKRLFYAVGPVTWSASNDRVRNPYSDYGYYFLTENDNEPLTIGEQEFTDSFYPGGDFMNSLYEVDDFAWHHSGRDLYDSRAFANGTSRDYTITSAGASADGTVQVVMAGNDASSVTVSVNDSVVGKINIGTNSDHNLTVGVRASSVFRVRNLQASNKITLNQTGDNTVRLDYIVVHNNKYSAAPDLHAQSFPAPEYVYHITNQDHHADEPADMIILLPTTQKLRAQAERLKELRETNDGMRVRIVPADELYNEFSSGTPDATAYRRYLKMFYDRAETDDDIPKYLVMFGDGAWDNRMLSADWQGYSPDDFLLTFQSENSLSTVYSYTSDDFFCMLDDGEAIQTGTNMHRGKGDVAVGRFPVRTEEEAKTMIDKIADYVNNKYAGSWQNTVVFMGDDGDNNTHMITANKVADDVAERFPLMDVKKIMWDTYQRQSSATGFSYPDVENIVKQYMTNGALIMNYSGHGSPTTISHELVLRLNDFKTTRSANLPLWITASCDITPYDSQIENIGETALFNKNGGAVAFFGTTRTVLSHLNEYMNLAFMREVLKTDSEGKAVPIGEAVRLAKNNLSDSALDIILSNGKPGKVGDTSSNKLHYILLGDPSLRLAIPSSDIVIDSINDVDLTTVTGSIQLKAGTPVTMKGHVEKDGTKLADFNGRVTAIVRDAKELVTGRRNDPKTEQAISYYDRHSTIFKGTDSIRGGEFTVRFIVPADISYSDNNGQIVTYAVSDDKTRTAHGTDESIVLNGSVGFGDTAGPSIYCYLNSPSFTNGGRVNPTPHFTAELFDNDGINSTGSGIGHSMQLTIDGEASRTYELNDHFTFDFGTYKSGRVEFSIPQLPEGEHRLLFRAWDVFNNPSTAELTFNVDGGQAPALFDVECTQNPAITSTSFRIIHDRIDCDLDVVLDIFDMSGRHLWTHSAKGVPSDNTMTIDWDLTINGGKRLGTGVYLYRVGISSGNSGYSSKAKKLIVLSNK